MGITSMGHWAELSKIDTSLESVSRVAQKNFGVEESKSFQTELANATTDVERTSVIQNRAKSLVSKSAPSRMKCRTKFLKYICRCWLRSWTTKAMCTVF